MPEPALPTGLDPKEKGRLRTAEGTYDLTPVVLRNIASLRLDCLVTIGGDDTLSFSEVLVGQGIRLVAVPKTMDNDVQGTEYCIGFSTAVTRAKELVDRQRTTLGSHERIGIFRIFGRDAGFSALHTAYVTSTRCLIPEAPFELERLVELLVDDKRYNPSRYALVIAAEGAMWKGGQLHEYGPADAYGHRRKANIAETLAAEIRARTGEETLPMELTYDLRSGQADALDQTVAITYANIAVDLIRDGMFGRMVAIQGGNFVHTTLPAPKKGPRRVAVARQYNLERLRPKYAARTCAPRPRRTRPLLASASSQAGAAVTIGLRGKARARPAVMPFRAVPKFLCGSSMALIRMWWAFHFWKTSHYFGAVVLPFRD